MTDFARQFGSRVRAARTRRGFTQAALAEAADVGANYVPRLERGELTPSVEAAHRLASALGVPVDALCNDPDERPAADGDGRDDLRILERLSDADIALMRDLLSAVDQLRGSLRDQRRRRR